MKRLREKAPKTHDRRIDNLLLVLIVLAGIGGAIFAGTSVYTRNREFLLGRAQTLAAALPIDDIKKLSGDETDLANSHYLTLKEKLTKVRQANKDERFVYITGRKGDTVFFNVDSESSDSKDYSPPGQTYPEASEKFKRLFDGGPAFVEGPYRDRWGNWLSALAPIIDPTTGKLVGVAGIDSSASSNLLQVALYSLFPLALAAVPFVVVLRERKVKRAQEEVNLLKTRFVSVASHELRSPLNGILWAIQSLLKKPADAAQEEMLTDMYVSAELSLATVNEILDLSIFERGSASAMHHDPVDLVTLMAEVQKALKLAAKEKNLVINMSHAWPKHARVVGDAGALKRAIMNVVTNAIKYSPDTSEVVIDYRHEHGQHVVIVKDSGIGIPKDELHKVLSGYYRARNTTKVEAHGTGLGLWITQLVVQQHKGKFWIESEENRGTSVYIALPELAINVGGD